MKTKFAILLIVLGIGACKTDCPEPTPTPIKISKTDWTLHYNEGSSGNDIYYSPYTFIKNGIAFFPSNLTHGRLWFASYSLPVPAEINLNLDTDSIKMVANVKNTNGDGTAYEIDLALVYNTVNISQASASWQKGTSPLFCILGITGQTLNNITEQLTDPTSFAEYGIEVKGNQVISYKNNIALKSKSYTGSTGTLKEIEIAFRGYGEIEWVKLYKGNKLIMTEDFNTNGISTAIWTLP